MQASIALALLEVYRMNQREGRGRGLRLKASVAPNAVAKDRGERSGSRFSPRRRRRPKAFRIPASSNGAKTPVAPPRPLP
jgi:hypothetical protein